MARNKTTGRFTVDSYGLIVEEKAPKNTWATGWGDELAYHDEDGFTRHIPPRTEFSHPYGFDPIVLFDTGTKHESAVYHDRMQQWDHDKFQRCLKKAGNVGGELHFRWGNREQVTKFMRLYNDDPKLVVTKCVKIVNMASGYPIWIIYFNTRKK